MTDAPGTRHELKSDQDVVNMILALAITVDVEAWRAGFGEFADDETIPGVTANAILDLQVCARAIKAKQQGVPVDA